MQILYKNKNLKKICTNIQEAKKKYSGKIPEKLISAINYISSAPSLNDVIEHYPFHFHDLKGVGKGLYVIDIGGRTSKYRLIFIPKMNDGTACTNEQIYGSDAINIEIIQVEEVSNHYE